MCSVWGGPTGARCAPLKENGTVRTFTSYEEAQGMVDELYERRKTHPLLPGVHSSYVVREEP